MPRRTPPATTADLVAARELWPLAAAAERLGVSTKTLYRERDRGRLTIAYVGVRAYLTDKEIRRYIAALDNGGR